jgi:hypothetical protein
MGGSALLIYGKVDDALLQPRQAPRSMLDRLFGRSRLEAPSWSPIGSDRRMIELPTDGLKALGTRFRDHVARRLEPKWAATAAVLDYLGLGVTDIQVRGDASGSNPPDWYVQLSFSGCAGMAEVSSELAAHWAERWYRAEQADIQAKYFRPYGFEPTSRVEPDRQSSIFVPLGGAGYALYQPTPRDSDEEYVESRHFDIDASALETLDALDEGARADALRKIDEQIPGLLKRSCCCQWCAPDFDAAAVDRLVPFH